MAPNLRTCEGNQQGTVSAAVPLGGAGPTGPATSGLDGFREHLRGLGYAPHTGELYTAGARDLLLFLAGRGKTIETIGGADLAGFRDEILAAKGRSSALSVLTGVRHFLRQCAEAGRCRSDVLSAMNRWRRKEPLAVLPPGLEAVRAELEAALQAAGLAEDTRASYRRAWRDFLSFLADEEGVEGLASVTPDVVTAYRVSRQTRTSERGRPLGAASQRSAFAALRFLFSWLVRTGKLLSDPTRHLRAPRRAQTLPRVPSVREVLRLLERAPRTPLGYRDRALLEVLYGTGMRRGELVRLDLDDLDLAQGELLVREGKGRKDRVVPLGKEARKSLVAYLEAARPKLLRGETKALFLGKGGRRMSRPHLTDRVRTLGERAGMKLRPHALRHACATHLLRGRADIRQIQRLLGHKTLSTTERYTRVEVSDLRAVIRRCHPRERGR